MTITKNQDCTTINIAHDLFEGYKDSTNDVTALNLFYTVNGGAEQTYEILPEDISEGAFAMDVAFFDQTTTTLCDGVYCFRLVIEEDTTETTEYGNILVDCALLCSLATYVWNNPTKQLHAKYEAIKWYQQCNNCDCTTVYSLYQDLLIDLDINTNTDCGC